MSANNVDAQTAFDTTKPYVPRITLAEPDAATTVVRRLHPATNCANCRQHAERIQELEQQVQRLTRAIQREADHHWDKRTTDSGK